MAHTESPDFRSSSGSGRGWGIVSFKASSNRPIPDSFFFCRGQALAWNRLAVSNLLHLLWMIVTLPTFQFAGSRPARLAYYPIVVAYPHICAQAITPFSSFNWRVRQLNTRTLCLVGDPPSRIALRVGGRGFPGPWGGLGSIRPVHFSLRTRQNSWPTRCCVRL